MRVGFTGSREYPDPYRVADFVVALATKYPNALVVSGGRGKVDKEAENTGVHCGLDVISFRPTETGIEIWKSEDGEPLAYHHPMHGHEGFVRNCFFRNGLIAEADRVVGFWDLQSRGTADTLSKAKSKGRPRNVYGPGGVALSEEQIDEHVHRALEPTNRR